MEGDAIGGSVNAIMKEAPDVLLVQAQLGTGYNQFLFDHKFVSFDRKSINFQDPDHVHGHYYATTQDDFTRQNLILPVRRPGLRSLGI
jgi:hypothetical protein